MYKLFRLDKKFIGQICLAKDWPGCPGLHSLHPHVSAAHRASVSQPTLAVLLFLAWSLFSLRIRRVVRIDELLPIAPAFSPPLPLQLQPSQPTVKSTVIVAGCGLLLLLLVPTWRHRLRQTPTATACPDVHRHALASALPFSASSIPLRSSCPSHFLSVSSSLSPLAPSFSFSPSLSLACVSHHHHHRRISWNRSHSQSRSRRMALPSFNSPLPVATLFLLLLLLLLLLSLCLLQLCAG